MARKSQGAIALEFCEGRSKGVHDAFGPVVAWRRRSARSFVGAEAARVAEALGNGRRSSNSAELYFVNCNRLIHQNTLRAVPPPSLKTIRHGSVLPFPLPLSSTDR